MKFSTELKAGLIALVSFASFFWLFNFLKGHNIFESGKTYYAVANNTGGLEPSKAITLNGLRVGRVNKIYFHPKNDGRIIIELNLKTDFPFTNKSTLEIASSLMSGAEVKLIPSKEGRLIQYGDTIQCNVQGGIAETLTKEIMPLKDKMQTTLTTLDGTLTNFNSVLDSQNKANIKAMLENLNTTVVTFKGTAEAISATSKSADNLIASNNKKIGNLLETSNTTMTKFGKTADKFQAMEIDKTMKNLEASSARINTILAKIDNGEGSMGLLLNDKKMYENLAQTSKNLEELTKDFKENPNRYVHFSIFGKKDKKPEPQKAD